MLLLYIGFRWFSVDPFGPTKSFKKNRTSKVYRKKEPDWINSRDTLRSSHEQAARVGLHETSCRFLFSHGLASAPSMDSFIVSWSVEAAKGAWQTLTHWENVWRLKWYPTDILKEWPIWCHIESSHITFLGLRCSQGSKASCAITLQSCIMLHPSLHAAHVSSDMAGCHMCHAAAMLLHNPRCGVLRGNEEASRWLFHLQMGKHWDHMFRHTKSSQEAKPWKFHVLALQDCDIATS